MAKRPGNVVELHERITVTFPPAVSKLIRAEIERQIREGVRVQTAQEIAEEGTRHVCEVMAMEIPESWKV
jgi:hypothetical protein